MERNAWNTGAILEPACSCAWRRGSVESAPCSVDWGQLCFADRSLKWKEELTCRFVGSKESWVCEVAGSAESACNNSVAREGEGCNRTNTDYIKSWRIFSPYCRWTRVECQPTRVTLIQNRGVSLLRRVFVKAYCRFWQTRAPYEDRINESTWHSNTATLTDLTWRMRNKWSAYWC